MSGRHSRSHKRRPGPAPARRAGTLFSSGLPSRGVLTFAAVGLFIATLALYWPTRAFDFVWDDLAYHLAANNALMAGDIATFWRQPYKDFYSPVTYTTWIWLANLSRASAAETAALRPQIFHAANILLHASNTVLVFFLVFGLTRKLVGALLGAVVFAIHPMQVESVAWISEYRGLLAVFFSLTALMLYRRCRFAETARARWWWVAVASVSFVLALLSKPSVVALPMVIAALNYATPEPAVPHPRWLVPALWTILALPLMILTKAVQPDAAVEFIPTLGQRFAVASDAVTHYGLTLFWPVSLAASYGRTPAAVLRFWTPYVLCAVPVALAFMMVALRRRFPLVIVCGAIVLAALLPVSGIVPFKGQNFSTVADRYFYFAMFGVGIAMASTADRLKRSPVFWVAAAVVLTVLISLNRQQQRVWRNDVALFGHVATLYPDQPRVHNDYGAALQTVGRHAEAVEQFSIAIALAPGFADPYCNRGSSFGGLKQFEDALRDQSRALELDSTDGGCAYNRAITYLRMGRYREALVDLERARALNYPVPAELENSIRHRLQ